MIVDDEPDITTTLKAGLEVAGFVVDVFNHPEKALSSLEPSKYDAALVDVRMPGMGGFELSRQIKQIDNDVEIYFITAFEIHAQEFKKIFPSSSVRHFIKKPFMVKEVVKLLNEDLESKKTPDRSGRMNPVL